MFNLAEQCVMQRVQGRTVVLLHVIHNVEPCGVEGFKLVISIVVEHIQMVRIVEDFSVIGGFEASQDHGKQLSTFDEVTALSIQLVLHGHVILHLHRLVSSIVNDLSQSMG